MIYILIGVSGSGKSTLGTLLEDKCDRLVTHTTRPKRTGELDNIHYHFVTKDEFEKVKKVEWTEYAGNSYGLSCKEVEDKIRDGKDSFLIMDSFGPPIMRKLFPGETCTICITIPEELVEVRLSARGDKDSKGTQMRIAQAIEEQRRNIELADVIIENVDLGKAKKRLLEIVR